MARQQQDESSNQGPEQCDTSPNKSSSNPMWSVARAVGMFQARSGTKVGPTSQAQRKRSPSHWSYTKRDSFIERLTNLKHYVQGEAVVTNATTVDMEAQETDLSENRFQFLVEPDGSFLFYWLMLVTCAVLYNMWVPVARFAFYGLGHNSEYWWLSIDLFFDAIYLIDIFVQARTVYMEHGLFVEDGKLLAKRYFRSRYFLFDVLSLLPVDLIVLMASAGYMCPWLRFLRWFKVYRVQQFTFKIEAASSCPNFWRICSFVHTLLFLVHFVAALYLNLCHVMLAKSPSSSDTSTTPSPESPVPLELLMDPNVTFKEYVNATYWSTITLTTIGDVPEPTTEIQFILQIIGYLIGIFVFATIVGQVGTVVDQRNAGRMEFERQLDHAKKYMREHDVPKEVQQSILGWYQYNWSRGKSVRRDDTDSFEMLPTKLRTELAIHVNLKTLKKVSFFTTCEPEFLHDLVLRMQLVVTTPGELVCRKGEVAREMFIISDGLLEVTGDDDSVIRTLQAGDYFGEIGLLMMDGSRRRTADVRSLGYSDLFVVTKEDILNLLEDYPNAKEVMHERARSYSVSDRMRQGLPHKRQTGLSRQDPHRSSKRYKDRMRRSILVRNSTNYNDLNVPQRASWATSFRQKRYQNAMDRKKGDNDTNVNGSERKIKEDIAREVMTSIEDVLFEKLSRVSREYNRLYTRSKVLEEELDRKTKELDELKSKHLSTSSGSEQVMFKAGNSDTDAEEQIW